MPSVAAGISLGERLRSPFSVCRDRNGSMMEKEKKNKEAVAKKPAPKPGAQPKKSTPKAAPKAAPAGEGKPPKKKKPPVAEPAMREGKPQRPSPRPQAKAVKAPAYPVAPSPKTVRKPSPKGKTAEPAPKVKKSKKPTAKLRVVFLGGLHEIGKNMCAIEYGNDIVVIDAGIAFPDEEMPGVDLVIPDTSYLTENAGRVRGVLLTHGHEDHIGGVPYLLRELHVPVYGTALTLGILSHKLEEVRLPKKPDLRRVKAGDTVTLGAMRAEFVHVNHSIPDASAIALTTPVGTVFHTGDYKLDVSPIGGRMMDVGRIARIGDEGVLLLLGESTNAERVGYTPSERRVGNSLEHLYMKYPDRRLVVATFSSNVHRVQQIIDASVRHGRHVVVFGRSMTNVVGAAVELGYITAPEGTIIGPQDMKRYNPEQLTLLTTGSQGEPMSALYRMAFGAHDRVTLSSQDVVVLSSSAIPGNEKLIGKIINTLIASGIRVENDDSIEGIHVSGHACSEELKLMIALTRPRYFMPIHGEARHLFAHKEIAEFMGIAPENIFLGENGRVLELDKNGAAFAGSVPAGRVLIDGSGIGDVGTTVLRDRKLLSEDGLIAVVATVDRHEGLIMAGPEIVSRGFVYVKEAESLMDEVRTLASKTLEGMLDRGVFDFNEMKNGIKEELSRLLFKKTKRRPMILPIILDL